MKKLIFIKLLLIAFIMTSTTVFAKIPTFGTGSIDPIVTTDWLAENSNTEGLVILDIRPEADYQKGHIPDSVSAPFIVPESIWVTMRDDLLLEVPDEVDLFDAIGDLGIEIYSKVVIIADPVADEPPFYGLSSATRVATTLIYAGAKNVSILDGGYSKWVAENREVTTDVLSVETVTFDGSVDSNIFVSTNYVAYSIFTSILIDARDAEVYYGDTIEPYAEKPGHIYGAASLPAPWIWKNVDGDVYTYKDLETLSKMAENIAGTPEENNGYEIIVYCGVGGYASSWWYLLTQVLGYENVKFYDGSAQEWVREYDMKPFEWQD